MNPAGAGGARTHARGSVAAEPHRRDGLGHADEAPRSGAPMFELFVPRKTSRFQPNVA